LRVALFFDGKNHMKALRRAAADRWLDHGALAEWVVSHVGGSTLAAAYYYTGVPSPHEDNDRHALSDLLDELERRPGFFVRRFNRRASTRECPHCGEVVAYTEEKMVDTSIVADMILLATRDAFDIAVVFSGDLDIAPGLAALHALGKRGWVATFGDDNLSRTLSRSAWGVVDLLEHVHRFSFADLATSHPRRVPTEPTQVDDELLRELRRAEAHFEAGGGFVGAHYFIHRWKGHHIPDAPELRRQAVQRLIDEGRAETYEVDGKTALRVAPSERREVDKREAEAHGARERDREDDARELQPVFDDDDSLAPGAIATEVFRRPVLDEDETVEVRIPDAIRSTIRRRVVVRGKD
jgi:uncharacterized LabA/DUF88 family protein